jgi:hypothetical protein
MGFKDKLSKYFFQMGLYIFFSNSDRDFYSENNNIHITNVHLNTKNSQKKKCKKMLLSSMFHFALKSLSELLKKICNPI